jgi:CubicO group peptidase (beta-lactamase class C family)
MNVDDITFRHLFKHQSGFNVDGSASDYATMKSKVAAGVGGVGMYAYENMNFGLMRILIPIINGDVLSRTRFMRDNEMNDKAWDATTLLYFLAYMQANVFNPAGVSNVQFKPVAGIPHALAYRVNDSGDGWNSGDISAYAGGAAFHLSVKELLNVLDHVRRKNTIIPAAKAQYMLDNLFGLDQEFTTPAGKIYNKNGMWLTSCVTTINCKTEQSVIYFLPNNMEVAVFVNSPIGSEGFSLRDLVRAAFNNSLTQ